MSRWRIPFLVAAILPFAGVIGYFVFAPGIQVSIRNSGTAVMRDVTVHVTGRAYSLGDLKPGEVRTKKVSPRSESHAEVEFTDEQGRRVRLAGGGYFEPGYRGSIDLDIRDGTVTTVKNDVRTSIY